MTNPSQPITSAVGDLEWVIISGKGKKNMSGKMEYKVDVVLDGEEADELKSAIDAFWKEHKPSGAKKAKSTGYYPHTVATDKKDGDGDVIRAETGKTAFVFKTGVTYKDGGAKNIPVYNAKGAEVSLGTKKVGNGSRGRVQGVMGIYKNEANMGVSLYLNGLQIAKFVEYSGGVNFDELGSDYGDFDGFDDGMGAISETTEVSSTDQSDKVEI